MKDTRQLINQQQHSNISFDYLYRDTSNYKDSGCVVFLGDGMSIRKANQRLALAFDSGQYFIAHQIGIPEVFLWNRYPISDDDHSWLEFAGLEVTTAQATDLRTLTEVVEAVEKAAKQGWHEFEPSDREKVERLAWSERHGSVCDLGHMMSLTKAAAGRRQPDTRITESWKLRPDGIETAGLEGSSAKPASGVLVRKQR
ncbi:MAG: hypothetical protein ABSH40_07510 [Bryobacteraceae bacterium]|jgi:hypothetical protein